MADAYFRLTGIPIPVYTSTGPGRCCRHGRARSTTPAGSSRSRPGGDHPVRQRRAAEVHRLGRLPQRVKPIEAELAGPHRRGPGQDPPEGVQDRPRGRPGPVHIDVPYDLWIRTGGVDTPDEHSRHLNWRTLGNPEAVAKALDILSSAAAADPSPAGAATEQRVAEHEPGYYRHATPPAAPRHRRLLGRVPATGRAATPT